MIEVVVHYLHKKLRNKNNDYFIYPYFMVKGHANNGKEIECVRVCAGVSACVIGIQRLIDYDQYSVICKTGVFEIKLREKPSNRSFVDQDTNYGLNTLLCQLYDLKNMYPTQFSRFELIEVKENEENEEIKPNPRPFRKLKGERK